MTAIVVLHEELDSSGVLSEVFEHLDCQILETSSYDETLRHCVSGTAQVVFVSQQGDSGFALAALTRFKKDGLLPSFPIVVVTADCRGEDVIAAMMLGAFDHLSKPVALEDARSVMIRALHRPKPEHSNRSLVSEETLIGLCPGMKQAEKLAGIAAAGAATVLVRGETGTGKTTFARMIHRHSSKSQAPLTIIDCTAVPEYYESFQSLAPGAQGTVILDEIGDLTNQTQAILVRALKEAEQSATQPRVIATTQYDLISMVREKRFREDLYYRLNVISVCLPPLRERASDILLLAEYFLQQARAEAPKSLSSSAAKLLLDYDWPGNVRELQNLMYHLDVAVKADLIEPADLSLITAGQVAVAEEEQEQQEQQEQQELDYYKAISALERKLLARALQSAAGSRSEAARLLGINRQLLYAKLKAHGLMDQSGG